MQKKIIKKKRGIVVGKSVYIIIMYIGLPSTEHNTHDYV